MKFCISITVRVEDKRVKASLRARDDDEETVNNAEGTEDDLMLAVNNTDGL